MKRLLLYAWLLDCWLALGGCVDRYTPDVPPAAQANLVVDGFINPLGKTVIKLGRSFSVNSKNLTAVEARARVTVQDDAGQRYPLAERPAGTYTSAVLGLDAGKQYQVRITTAQGRDYASELVPVVLTPRIDTLTWKVTPQGGVQIYLGTHNATAAARYYHWEYEETYQFIAPQGGPYPYCWRTEYSTPILQGTTTQLSQNALIDYPLLTALPSVMLRFGYSVLVRQITETQAEYDYWERLRKNTENLGTVNDPLPGRVTGNVHALADAAEPVLGYVGVHSVTEKRLLMFASQFPTPRPASIFFDPAYAFCVGSNSLACTDCSLRGTPIKPSYWP